MSGDGTIRRAQNSDAERLQELHYAAIRSAGSNPADVPGNEDIETPEASFHEQGGELLVIEQDGTVVAMGGYKPRGEDTVELLRMAVAPDAQGAGYGSRLIAALESRAGDAGYDTVELETTARQTQAMGFYPHHGYTEVGRRQDGEYEIVRFEKSLYSRNSR